MTKIWLETLKHPLEHYDRACTIRVSENCYYVLVVPEGSVSWVGGERATPDLKYYSEALQLERELDTLLAANRKMMS